MNQNPAQRQKGWGWSGKSPPIKRNTGGQSCQKQTRTPPRPLVLTESTWNKGDSWQRDRTKGNLVRGKNYGRELNHQQLLEHYWRLGKGHEKTLESDVKNNPKRKRQLLRKAVGEFKTLLTVKSSQKQRRTATNPLKFKETLKETTQKKGTKKHWNLKQEKLSS